MKKGFLLILLTLGSTEVLASSATPPSKPASPATPTTPQTNDNVKIICLWAAMYFGNKHAQTIQRPNAPDNKTKVQYNVSPRYDTAHFVETDKILLQVTDNFVDGKPATWCLYNYKEEKIIRLDSDEAQALLDTAPKAF
jgi:hypothetical protein